MKLPWFCSAAFIYLLPAGMVAYNALLSSTVSLFLLLEVLFFVLFAIIMYIKVL